MQVGLISTGVNAAPAIGQSDKDEKAVEAKVLSKDEAKNLMKSKEFEYFINKTSKIVERALGNSTDVLGAFFDDGSDENAKAALNMGKNDRIQTLFTF